MKVSDAIALARPRQWTKNLAVYAGLIFSGNLMSADLAIRASVAFVAFDLIAGGLYAANDAIDAGQDREHPLKKNRPVASGRVAPWEALSVSAISIVLGLLIALWLGTPFLLATTGYLLIHALYVTRLKHVAIVDMLVIATGFVIRAVAGAVVIDVPVSPWLVLCTGLLALFLAAAKRRHEILLLGENSSRHRPVLAEYSAELLDSFMVTLSASTVTSYALYTFFETRSPSYSMMLTLPFVIYGILRYQYLVLHRGGGGRPEDVLLSDRPIMVDIALWVTSAVLVLYVVPRYL